MTIVFSHPACMEHNMGEGHPERPARLNAVEQALQKEGINFKTKEKQIISQRNVLLFKPSKEFKEFINSNNE